MRTSTLFVSFFRFLKRCCREATFSNGPGHLVVAGDAVAANGRNTNTIGRQYAAISGHRPSAHTTAYPGRHSLQIAKCRSRSKFAHGLCFACQAMTDFLILGGPFLG